MSQAVETRDYSSCNIRVYGGRQCYFSIAEVHMYSRIHQMPKDLLYKIVRKVPHAYLAELTLPWLEYKVDLQFYASKADNMAKVKVVPTTAQMIIRGSSLKMPSRKDKGCVKMTLGNHAIRRWVSPETKKVGDITLENVLRIAKQIHEDSLSKTFLGTVKQVMGQVHTLGLTIDNKPPRFYQNRIDQGLKFIDEEQILPYLDEDGMPWHVPNPQRKGRTAWYVSYPKLAEEVLLVFDEPVEEEEEDVEADTSHGRSFKDNPEQVEEYVRGGEKKVSLVCKHWLQQMCNKSDTCQYLHTMQRE